MKEMLSYANQNQTEIRLEDIPHKVAVIPLRNAVVFPAVLLPIFVGRNESIQLIENEGKPGALVGLFTQRSQDDEEVDKSKLYHYGTLAEVHQIATMSEGGYQVLLQGVHRIKLNKIIKSHPYLQAEISPLREIRDVTEKQYKEFQERVVVYIKSHSGIPKEVTTFVRHLDNPSALANQIMFFSQKGIKQRIQFLKINRVSEKIKLLTKELIEETNRLRLEREVQKKVEQDTTRMQKEFYLRKQLDTIRKELGDLEDDEDDLEKQLAKIWLPEHIRKAVNKEVKRLHKAQEGMQSNAEASQIRNWLELVLELPWEASDKKEISLRRAAEVLEEDHEGLEEVKKHILEFLAVEKQTNGSRAPILCLVGPPGVGKTSLAHSIARALGRPIVRAALGGVRDEAEIRGHRRTYVGAMPGKILSAMKKAKTTETIFLLDEIDKLGSSYHGDPSSALLEVLDPEQNNAFEDHYLAEAYDLSHVLFVCTANTIDTIPAPLLDRMELVRISGYTLAEKKAIVQKHLLPRINKELQLEPGQISLTEAALEKVIVAYTREAGVRNLKRKLEALARKTIRSLLEEMEKEQEQTATKSSHQQDIDTIAKEQEEKSSQSPISEKIREEQICYDLKDIAELLGRERYHQDCKENTDIPGVAIGLAWTPTGGDILFIEATAYKGKGELKLSGQLGDVMKESALTALSFLRTRSKELGIDPSAFIGKDIHIHVPSGAIPKDGPSAGVTLLSALSSLFSQRPVATDIAMTGEISLRGRILPVGGIKEKILAARAAKINTVFLPEQNRAEFEEIPEHVRKGINVKYYSDMLELLRYSIPDDKKKEYLKIPIVPSSLSDMEQREGW